MQEYMITYIQYTFFLCLEKYKKWGMRNMV